MKSTLIEKALRRFVAITRAHRYGGMLEDYPLNTRGKCRLARAALEEYRPKQLRLPEARDERVETDPVVSWLRG